MKDKEEQIILFADRTELRNWLDENHEQEESIWIKFNKTEMITLKHRHALEEALCYGWIDSQVKRIDDTFYKMKFSKRRKNSKWSEYNRKTVDKLIKSGMMTIHGKREIDRAKKNGNWSDKENKTYLVDDKNLIEKLSELEEISAKYKNMSQSAKKSFTLYYNGAKLDETKAKRLKIIIDHIRNNKRIF